MDWFQLQQAKEYQRLKAIEAQTAGLGFELKKKDWRLKDVSWSTVPDVVYPWNEHIVRDIQRDIDPAFTPLFVKFSWLSPWDELFQFGRHAFGRVLDVQKGWLPDFNPSTQSYPFNGITVGKPGVIVDILQGEQWGGESGHELDNPALPQSYVPFDSRVYYGWKNCFLINESEKQMVEKVREQAQEAKRAEYKVSEADREADIEFNRYAEKVISAASDVEIRDHMLGDHLPETKPTVYLSGKGE